jgi:hypothetical protein
MVTVIDPYSGTMASANTMQVFPEIDGDYQSLTIKPAEGDGYARGDFEVLTGQAARGVTVRIASYPEPGSVKEFALGEVTKRGWDFNQYSCLLVPMEFRSRFLPARWLQLELTGEPILRLRSGGDLATSMAATDLPAQPLCTLTKTTGTNGQRQKASRRCEA